MTSSASESRVGRCIRTPDYLYSVYADDFLYDLKRDPWQLDNVVEDPAYAQAKGELRARLADWIRRAEGTRPVMTD